MKTPIRRLDSLTHNDTAATKLINDNFEALQQGVEDALSRSGKKPNFMDDVLDMNMHRIINIADPVDDYDLANKHYVDTKVSEEETRAKAAEAALQRAIDDEKTARINGDNALRGLIRATGSASIYSRGATYVGTDTAEIDVSDIVEDGVAYVPIVTTAVTSANKEARKTLNSVCWYYKSTKKVQLLFTDNTYQSTNNIQYNVTLLGTEQSYTGDGIKGITDGLDGLIDGLQTTGNLVTSLSGSSTDSQYPSAKCVYDALQNTGGGADGIVIRGDIVFAEDSQLPTGDVVVSVDVSSYVEDGQDYMPIYSCYANYEHLSNTITYNPTLKTVSVHVDHTYHIGHYIRGDLYLIPVERKDSNPTLPSGITNGLYIYEVQSATQHYIQTSDNLVTSLSGSSTDTQYPSAKCVYDIVGDIETLLAAI